MTQFPSNPANLPTPPEPFPYPPIPEEDVCDALQSGNHGNLVPNLCIAIECDPSLDFATAARYMAFTDAVHESSRTGVRIPL